MCKGDLRQVMATTGVWIFFIAAMILTAGGERQSAESAIIMAMLFYILKRLEDIEARVK